MFFLEAVERGHLELADEDFLTGRAGDLGAESAIERSLVAVANFRSLARGAADTLCAGTSQTRSVPLECISFPGGIYPRVFYDARTRSGTASDTSC